VDPVVPADPEPAAPVEPVAVPLPAPEIPAPTPVEQTPAEPASSTPEVNMTVAQDTPAPAEPARPEAAAPAAQATQRPPALQAQTPADVKPALDAATAPIPEVKAPTSENGSGQPAVAPVNLNLAGPLGPTLAAVAAGPRLSIPSLTNVLDPVPSVLNQLIGNPATGAGSPSPAPAGPFGGRQAADVGMGATDAVFDGSADAAAPTAIFTLPLQTSSVNTIAGSPGSGNQDAPGDPGNLPGSSTGAAEVAPNGLLLFGFAALLLVALMAAAPAFRRMIQIASACWRPVPFVALLERPG
jgi:hypothetical protein